MHVVLGIGRGDQEDQVDRFSVQRVKVHAVLYHHGRQSRTVDKGAFSVGDRDSLTDTGGAFFFSAVNLLAVSLPVVDLSAFDHQVHHLVQGFLFGGGGSREGDASLIQ